MVATLVSARDPQEKYQDPVNPMTLYQFLEAVINVVIFLLGACVGSFLNVAIYRLPLGMSVNQPRRSFCPNCKEQIPWYLNIPIYSWISLRGKCARCKVPISPRYLTVEAVTGVFFLFVWLWFPWNPVVLAYWVLISLLMVAFFVDLDHYIIPDEVTIGGTVSGLVFSIIFPSMMLGQSIWWKGFLWSLGGAAFGFGILWMIVELGKLAFGKLRKEFDEPEELVACQDDEEEEPVVTVAGERYYWSELFFRKSDRLVIDCEEVKILGEGGKAIADYGAAEVTARGGGFSVKVEGGGEGEAPEHPLESVEKLEAKVTRLVIPREAMGFGDVKLMAAVGAFLSWKAVLFTIFAGAVFGMAIAVPARITGRQEWAAKIPFGPYLVAGAVLWLFFGERIVDWYFRLSIGG